MSSSSSKVRNFRRRSDDNDDDDTTTTTPITTTATPITTTTTTKRPQSRLSNTSSNTSNTSKPKKSNLLSFADDESTDEITPISRNRPSSNKQKPNSSSSSRLSSSSLSNHKLTSAKERKTLTPSSLPSNVQPQAGVYTKEALLELQKNTKILGRAPTPSEPVVVLKGTIKPVQFNNSNTNLSVDNRKDVNGENDDESDDGETMNQAMIDAIRAKRERLRQSRAAAPDFIALDTGSNHGEAEGLSDEEPEFQGRIALIGDRRSDVKKGVFEDVVVDMSRTTVRKESDIEAGDDDGFEDDEEDEEDKMWEEEQVRKGLGKRMDDGVGVRNVTSSGVMNVSQNVQQRAVYPTTAPVTSYPSVGGLSIGGSVGWSGSETVSIAQQAELSMKALHESISRLKETHSRTLTSLAKTDENLSDSLTKVTTLETALTAAGEKFIFMQKLRDYVSVICDFLQEKAPYIEELEYQMQKLHQERAEAILERRTADSNDELMELEASVNAAMTVFNKGGITSSMVEAASNAAQAALTALRESRNLPVKLDEFGRDVNLQKRMDMKRRAESRKVRKSRSEFKRTSSMETDIVVVEGESSTDESDSETTAYASNRDQLLQTADEIFGDADEEYSKLSVVKEKFEVWKKDYLSSYGDAYMSLSIPAIFSPYVRLELLKWDPLHEDSDFIDMQWHELLFNYGLPTDESKVNPDDADVNLIPDLVEKVAIPILQHQISHCWDIFSTKETKFAVLATNLVFRYVPLSSKAVTELVAVLCDRLSDAVSNLMVPTWNTYILRAVPNAARFAAYRFGMSVRLMRNICLWNDVLSISVLEKLALDDLLSGKILPHLRSIQSNINDAITRTERIVASFAGVWTGRGIPADKSRKLQPMVDYLLVLGRTLEKRQSVSGTNALARRLKKMLVELNEYDHARNISRTFNLKEAL
ncbi:transcriptional repressor ILP1-like [Rutidosis leptorrhynchoides]|uniref:transcriptional repressor ILP1-like n=1 Tax=Rutidosis leptorrhynchoides TaxID=125765 RepID=UPI003A9A64D2